MTRLWRTVGVVAIAVIGIWMVSVLFKGLLIVFAGILLAIFLSHLSRKIERLSRLPYTASLCLVVLAIVAVFSATGYFMGSRISAQISEFSEMFSTASDQAWKRFESLGLRRWVDGAAATDAQDLLSSDGLVMSSARAGMLGLLSMAAAVVIIVFLGLYAAIDPGRYREGLVRLFPPRRRQRIDEVLFEIGDTLWAWTLGRLAGMALIGTGSIVGLWVIGTPLPVTLGVIAGLLNFVPNIGPVIASVPAVVLGLQQSGNSALLVVALYLVLQTIESYIITPLIDQQQVRLPPATTLSAQLLLGMLAGIMGLLLATPLTAGAHVLIRELYVRDTLESGSTE